VLAAVLLAAGVAVFVMAANPRAGQPQPDGRGAAAVIAAGAILAGASSAVAARARSGRVAGFALGLAAGLLYGLAGGALKAAVHAAVRDPLAALSGWPLWTLVALGGWGLIAHQRAYTHAPLGVSLPVLSVANPLAGIAFGVLAFGETLAAGPLALAGQAAGMAAIITSVTVLARAGPPAGRHPARPETSAPREPAVTAARSGRPAGARRGVRVSDHASGTPAR
jgi:drug/metabolite transporter (DMT)-like permease